MNGTQISKAQQWFELWKDNSNPDNINAGIISFARTCLSSTIRPEFGIPEIHKEMYMETLQLYHPRKTMMLDRQLQFELFRDAAKSTIGSFVLPLYITCMNGHQILIADTEIVSVKDRNGETYEEQRIKSLNGIPVLIKEDVILLMSETYSMAENWVDKIRTELSTNPIIKRVFGDMRPERIADEEGKWTRGCFRALRDKSTTQSWQKGEDVEVAAKGATQQIRGYNSKGRITLFIADDLYSLKTVGTVETRQKTRYRYSAEAKNGVDANTGKILSIGTKVHDDTIIVDNERNRRVKTIKHAAMDKDKFMYILDNYCKIDSEKRLCYVPSVEKCRELEECGYVTNWPERLSLKILLSQYSEAFEGKQEGQTLSMFWQEKFHETLSEEDKKFKRQSMKDLRFELVTQHMGGTKMTFVKVYNNDGSISYRNVNTCISIDAATSFSTKADDTAMVWILKDFYERIYFYRKIDGKFGINDTFKFEELEHKYVNTLCRDRREIERIGISDEIFRWLDKDNPHKTKFVIETNHVGHEVTRTIKAKMRRYGQIFNVIEVVNTLKNKQDRIADNLSKYAEAGFMYFNSEENWETLKDQLEYLGKTSKDDLADAASTGAVNLDKPNINISELKKDTKKKTQTYIQQKNLNKTSQTFRDVWRIS